MWPFTKKPSIKDIIRNDAVLMDAIQSRARADGWNSVLSGFGMPNHDKRQAGQFQHDEIDPYEAMEMWRGDPLAARIIETKPNEMLRHPFELCIDDDTRDLTKRITALWEDLQFYDALWMALTYENAYGGSAIYLGVNDLQDVSEVLDIERVLEVGFLEVLEPRELQPVRWQRDFTQSDFGKPTHYRLQPVTQMGPSSNDYGQVVHSSRLIIFPGIKVSRRQISNNFGWGDSLLGRCRTALRDYNLSWAAASVLIQDFSQVIYKLKGLSEAINFGKDQEIINRIRTIELSRSVLRATLIDADLEEFERKQTPLTGLPELLDRQGKNLATAADIPVTRLMGESPAGLSATGDADIRFFYDGIRSDQNRKLRPPAERLTRIGFSMLGEQEPKSWSIDFPALWQPTEKEQAETRKIQTDCDTQEIANQTLSPEEVRNSRHGGRKYSFQTKIDKDLVINPVLPPGIPPLASGIIIPPPKQLAAGTPVPENTGEEPKVEDKAPPKIPPKAEPTKEAPVEDKPKEEAPVVEEAAQALNGAQVTSLVAVVTAAVNGTISRESAVQMIMLAYNVSQARAEALLGPKDFTPSAPEVPEVRTDAADRHRQQVLNQLAPDGTCAACGNFFGTGALEVDHINGRDWDPNAMSLQQRGLKYLDEYNSGVSMQALCRSCNASDGAKNKQVR